MRIIKVSFRVSFLAIALSGCVDSTPADTANRSGDLTCPTCAQSYCAIASFKGPDFFAENFSSYADAKTWLASFGDTTDRKIVDGVCDVPLPCPQTYQPLCGQVSGGGPETFDNSCELEAETRHAAGSMPAGGAKGVTLHAGACEPASGPCEGKICGETCAGPFANPLPTFCDANGACVAGSVKCTAAYDCDLSHVACDALEPSCDPGYTPSVEGVCYGPCVPVADCKPVLSL